MENCIELKTKLPGFRKSFIFFDDRNHSAASLFNRYQVPIRIQCAWKTEDGEFKAICCKVRRKDVPNFKQAMEDLKTKMLLLGNLDYEAFCERFIKELKETSGS